jgi:hypothetical protein
MFKAEVQDHPALAAAWTHAHGHSDSRHDLQSVGEIVRPAYAGADQQGMRSLRLPAPNHRLIAAPNRARNSTDQLYDYDPEEPVRKPGWVVVPENQRQHALSWTSLHLQNTARPL